jgi:hypothetical protein
MKPDDGTEDGTAGGVRLEHVSNAHAVESLRHWERFATAALSPSMRSVQQS